MGIGSYFRTSTKTEAAPSPTPSQNAPPRIQNTTMSEKYPVRGPGAMELQQPTPRFHSRPQSLSGRSLRSNQSSLFIDEIKHEVMVNYLYQQQCSHLWVSDGSGEVEGVLLRKARGLYMACPPQLGNSALAAACTALNVQVRVATWCALFAAQ